MAKILKQKEPICPLGYQFIKIEGRPYRVTPEGGVHRFLRRHWTLNDMLKIEDPESWPDIGENHWKPLKSLLAKTSKEPYFLLSVHEAEREMLPDGSFPKVVQKRYRQIDIVCAAFFEGYYIECKEDYLIRRRPETSDRYSVVPDYLEVYASSGEPPYSVDWEPFLKPIRPGRFILWHSKDKKYYYQHPDERETSKLAFDSATEAETALVCYSALKGEPIGRLQSCMDVRVSDRKVHKILSTLQPSKPTDDLSDLIPT